MRIDRRSAAPGAKPAGGGSGPRSFAPRSARAPEGRSFSDKSDGWKAETDFIRSSTPGRVDVRGPPLDRTEALAAARLIAAELGRPGLRLGLRGPVAR